MVHSRNSNYGKGRAEAWSLRSIFRFAIMSTTEEIRVVIVDDEPIAREGIRVQIAKYPKASIVAECGDGLQAVTVIEKFKPDLVFLDVQMPGMDGFEVLQSLELDHLPVVVFVTAF